MATPPLVPLYGQSAVSDLTPIDFDHEPALRPGVRLLGDVIAAAHGPVGVVQPSVLSIEALLVGHHGSLTPAEQPVPFLAVSN